ncbi:daunorubicin resistance protein DrrC [Lactobacillus sp. CBA3606]|uniref:daunorubicin resistance protein DrrC n=1 Tax=Lactobacillus sp. CBA3606 TaxID=2099789 RepID=UPI000CFBA885|nr:daunorubicin resistance protein DrrC [Lactobacillus sp. CBA3606]AVK64300.1 daunorubicin resistance protein DrrC [Lactobacillus sp. CBA3606]
MLATDILIQGASTTNLQHINVQLPKHQITVVTGVAGAGQSSLILATLAAESQRLLKGSATPLGQPQLPPAVVPVVDKIEQLPVTIVIDQKPLALKHRSTVGTVTEIYAGLQLLFAQLAQPAIGPAGAYSFKQATGWCPQCLGTGVEPQLEVRRLINWTKSLNAGAIQLPAFQPGGDLFNRYTAAGNFDNDQILATYTAAEWQRLLYDEGSQPDQPTAEWPATALYVGVIPMIKQALATGQSVKGLTTLMPVQACSVCGGTRVNAHVRQAEVNGRSLADCVDLSVTELLAFINTIYDDHVVSVLHNLQQSLANLLTIGLGYLTMNRATRTLAGGEIQRLKLTQYLNSPLTDVLYILTTPSAGLHAEDLIGINRVFGQLRDQGNTVVIIDQNPAIIRHADHVIELGPGAGHAGGQVTFTGTYAELLKSSTVTGQSLRAARSVKAEERPFNAFYALTNVSRFNVHHATVRVPKAALTVVTGVAGAGKRTLIQQLFPAAYPGAKVFDQSLMPGRQRSNVLTYLGIFDTLRQLFAQSSGEPSTLFSFNGAGACPACHGTGMMTLDSAYQGTRDQPCATCHGRRYNATALAVKWHGYNIDDVLQLTAAEAITLVKPRLKVKLQALLDVKLGYIKLGQGLATFSGSELQRLKLAKSLVTQDTHPIFILDEPSTGLHAADVADLLVLLQRLVAQHKTVIVIEHNLAVISQAQWVIDMGLHAGRYGGHVLFEGPVKALLTVPKSFTAQHLRHYLKLD